MEPLSFVFFTSSFIFSIVGQFLSFLQRRNDEICHRESAEAMTPPRKRSADRMCIRGWTTLTVWYRPHRDACRDRLFD